MTTQTIVITGASRGLGEATARLAAAMGANVVLNSRAIAELSPIVHQIREKGGQSLAVAGDISQPGDCRRLIAAAVERFGGIDALVNNAATLEPLAPIGQSDFHAWQHSLAVNLLGPVALAQEALPYLRERQGRVINVSSGAAAIALTGLGAYCASKAALNLFSQTLAREEPDLTVLAFLPGTVDTTMQSLVRQEGEAAMAARDHALFIGFHEQGQLQPPEVPGRVLAALALRAPREWSGELVAWNEERVRRWLAD